MRILSILLFLPLVAFADEQQLVKQFFSQDGIKNKKEVYAGEMLEHYLDRPTLGESLPTGIEISLRALEKTPEREIYAVLLSKDGKSQDWYIYLINDQEKWKISAVRNLALPGLFFMALHEAQSKSERTKEEERQYQNMLLTLRLDSELKEFLRSNIDSLSAIASEAQIDTDKATVAAKALYLNLVRYEKGSGIVDVNIGGMLDNSVGYLFVPAGSNAPSMSDDNYIYIEHVVGNWYVYKTT
ncbi:hypothetical protein [Hahella sp. HN01]|uniref:hypothetical protein n=1 Tax=Hahella sp. HN01 TaxID=2847262 RepID=UPI001C1EE9A4|nr:hypothetical protein [Hahella sp. HN01]MBU6955057.1 hypothetical protein [Hahella sp. HN01]